MPRPLLLFLIGSFADTLFETVRKKVLSLNSKTMEMKHLHVEDQVLKCIFDQVN